MQLTDHPAFDPITDTWMNYGDHNPDIHGGRFIQWQGGMWKLVVTTSHHDLPDGYIEGYDQMVETYWFKPQDLFEDGDVEEGPTQEFRAILESLGESAPEPGDVPEGETYADAWTPIIERLDYYAADLPFHTGQQGGHGDERKKGDYGDILDAHGVNPDDVEGVADSTFKE